MLRELCVYCVHAHSSDLVEFLGRVRKHKLMSFLENLATLTPSHMSTAGNCVVRMDDMAVVQNMWEQSSVRIGSDRFMHCVAITTTSLIWVVKITSLFYR